MNDKMQKGYRYQLTEQAGRNFDVEFGPQLTPEEMLQLGVFGRLGLRQGHLLLAALVLAALMMRSVPGEKLVKLALRQLFRHAEWSCSKHPLL